MSCADAGPMAPVRFLRRNPMCGRVLGGAICGTNGPMRHGSRCPFSRNDAARTMREALCTPNDFDRNRLEEGRTLPRVMTTSAETKLRATASLTPLAMPGSPVAPKMHAARPTHETLLKCGV